MKKKWVTPEIREIFVVNDVVKGIEGIEKYGAEKLEKVKSAIEKKLKEIKK